MVWTTGHIWQTQDLEIRSATHFQYKYVVVQEGSEPQWERGMDRIADVKLLESLDGQS